MVSAVQQLRLIFRGLARAPLFTTVCVVTLAVGIGATATVSSVVHGVLLKPLPFPEPDRLVGLWHTAPGIGFDLFNQSPALYFTYREESQLLEESGMWDNSQASITGKGDPEQVPVIYVTDGIFPALRVQPLHGRVFNAEDDSPGTEETVVLSHRYWVERFGADPAAVGQTLVVDGSPKLVLGVMGPDLRFLDYDPALYLPFRFDRSKVYFGNFSYQGLGRLKPGATLEQLGLEMGRMIETAIDRVPFASGFRPEMVAEMGFGPAPRPLQDEVVGDVGRILWILFGTVGIVLLVACANVANLLLVRFETRRRELAVRAALGAGRRRLAGQLLLESLVLGALGGAAGLALAVAGVRFLVWLAPRGLPRLQEIALDPPVVLFALGVSLLSAVGFGLLPVLRLDDRRLPPMLKDGTRTAGGGRDRHLTRNALVTAQIALALVLMIGSGLMVRSFVSLLHVDPGFRGPDQVLTLRLSIPEAEVPEIERVAQLQEAILRQLEAIPGVASAGISTSITMDGWGSNDPIYVEEFPLPETQIPLLRRYKFISPNYFETMGNPLVAGRGITWADVHDRAPVVVVTENLAREYWPEPAAAIGKRIKPYPDSPWRQIVGVAGDVRDDGVDEEATTVAYWPLATRDFGEEGLSVRRTVAFALRSPRVGTPGFLDEVRSTIWAANPRLPLANVRTLAEILRRSTARTSFTLVMLAIAAGTALLLGGIGIYGVTSYGVVERRREIGVRMALGARPADVSALVLRQGLVLAGIGAAVGLLVALGATRLMAALLHGVSALDPTTYALGGVGVVALALLASYLPARRAAAVDPNETLRLQ
jgi:predicted permease